MLLKNNTILLSVKKEALKNTAMGYEPHIMKDTKLPFIFHINIKLHAPENAESITNWHENIELICCTSGRGRIFLDAEEQSLEAGQIIAINTNVMHRILPINELSYHCLIIDRKFCEANDIKTDGGRFEVRFYDEVMRELFERLVLIYRQEESDLKIAKTRKTVLEILIRLSEKHICTPSKSLPADKESEKIGIERIKSAIAYIGDRLFEKLDLDSISSHVGVSKYHFSRQFKEITGVTVVEYINICRCKYAKQLIKEGVPIAQAAEQSGFENMSYFTKTFKKYVGRLPSKL